MLCHAPSFRVLDRSVFAPKRFSATFVANQSVISTRGRVPARLPRPKIADGAARDLAGRQTRLRRRRWRSADSLSAVSQAASLRNVRRRARLADCQSATQQTASLRYKLRPSLFDRPQNVCDRLRLRVGCPQPTQSLSRRTLRGGAVLAAAEDTDLFVGERNGKTSPSGEVIMTTRRV